LRKAKTKALLKFLKPLGLKKRVKIFKRLVTIINREYNGKVPLEYRKLISLPGIGDYAASAVLLFADNERRGLVDVNTIRIFSRLFNKNISRERGKHSKFIRECADYFSSLGEDPRRANWYLLDYGASLARFKENSKIN
jgi:A/G-specific adenine glycosylase